MQVEVSQLALDCVLDEDTLLLRYQADDMDGYWQSGTVQYHISQKSLSDLNEEPAVSAG